MSIERRLDDADIATNVLIKICPSATLSTTDRTQTCAVRVRRLSAPHSFMLTLQTAKAQVFTENLNKKRGHDE